MENSFEILLDKFCPVLTPKMVHIRLNQMDNLEELSIIKCFCLSQNLYLLAHSRNDHYVKFLHMRKIPHLVLPKSH